VSVPFFATNVLNVLEKHELRGGVAAVIKAPEKTEPRGLACRAEFIFNSRTGKNGSRPLKVLSECMCDFRRPDWESRWSDWNSQRNPYLNLFLCAEHARTLGLME
jgi:hypothetical protein